MHTRDKLTPTVHLLHVLKTGLKLEVTGRLRYAEGCINTADVQRVRDKFFVF